MTRRALLILGWVLLSSPLVLAQGSADTEDPVTGKWGDDEGRTMLELTFDGKRTVTGTAIWHGHGDPQRTAIKTGTFDPKTGTLRLEGEARRPDGNTAAYIIEARIEKGVVTGTFKVGGEGGEFTFKKQ